MNIISLGAGVQSTTLAIMAARGDITPMPDCAIFADTGWEPKKVYDHLDWLEKQLPFPVYRVSAGNLREAITKYQNVDGRGRGRVAVVPWFLSNGGMGHRQCTKDYKIVPIRRKTHELIGGKTRKGAVTMWIGISMDEAIRMKPSRVQYIVNRWPLIDLRMTRRDCEKYLMERQYPKPPKSACIGCPYTNDNRWRDLRENFPEEWQDAVEVDKAIRNQPRMRAQQFIHRSCKPLDEVDLRTHSEKGQPDLFLNECEGLCGV